MSNDRTPSSPRKLENGLTIEEYRLVETFLMHPTMTNVDLWRKAVPESKANDQTAGNNTQEIMERPRVKAYIAERQKELFGALDRDIDEVDRKQFWIATADFTDCLDEEGILLPPSKWPQRARGAVKSLTVNRRPDGGETLRLEMHNPTESAKVVYMRRGLLVERKEVTGKDGGPIQVDARIEAILATLSDDDLRRLARGSGG